MGDRWAFALLVAAFVGVCRFNDFQKQLKFAFLIGRDRNNRKVLGAKKEDTIAGYLLIVIGNTVKLPIEEEGRQRRTALHKSYVLEIGCRDQLIRL